MWIVASVRWILGAEDRTTKRRTGRFLGAIDVETRFVDREGLGPGRSSALLDVAHEVRALDVDTWFLSSRLERGERGDGSGDGRRRGRRNDSFGGKQVTEQRERDLAERLADLVPDRSRDLAVVPARDLFDNWSHFGRHLGAQLRVEPLEFLSFAGEASQYIGLREICVHLVTVL